MGEVAALLNGRPYPMRAKRVRASSCAQTQPEHNAPADALLNTDA